MRFNSFERGLMVATVAVSSLWFGLANAGSLQAQMSGRHLQLLNYDGNYRQAVVSVHGSGGRIDRVFQPGEPLIVDISDLPSGTYRYSARVDSDPVTQLASRGGEAMVDANGRAFGDAPATDSTSTQVRGFVDLGNGSGFVAANDVVGY